jgi:hypothetical protein
VRKEAYWNRLTLKHVCSPLRPIKFLQTGSLPCCTYVGTCPHRVAEIEAWFVQYFEAMAFSELLDSAHCMESATTLPELATGVFVMHPVVESSSPIDTCAVVRACFCLLGQMSYNRGYAFLQLVRLGSVLRRNCLQEIISDISRRVGADILLELRLPM